MRSMDGFSKKIACMVIVGLSPKLIKKDGKMDRDHMILNNVKYGHQDGTKKRC